MKSRARIQNRVERCEIASLAMALVVSTSFYFSLNINSARGFETNISKTPFFSNFEEANMVELENCGIDVEDEEKSESPKLVFKFAFQIETFERLSREGYKSLSDDSGGEKESNFLCSSSSPLVISKAAASKYETQLAKNLTFILENPKAATFRVEDCLKEKQEKTEDYSVSSIEKKKFRFFTENDFLEFVDSSQTFTSNEDAFLSDSDFTEASLDQGQNRKNDNSGSGSGSNSDTEEEDANEFEGLWEHQDLIEQLKMEMKKVKAIGGLQIIREEEEEEDDCPKIMEDLKPWRIEEEKKFKLVDTIGEVHKIQISG